MLTRRRDSSLVGSPLVVRTERAILLLHALLLGLLGLLVVTFGIEEPDPADITLRILIAATFLGVGIDLRRRGERLVHLLWLQWPVVAAPLLMPRAASGDVTGGLVATAMAITAARLTRPVTYWLLMTSELGVSLAGHAWLAPRWDLHTELDSQLLGIVTVAFVVRLTDLVYDGVRNTDRLREEAERATDAFNAARAREQMIRTAGRVLHDDVLNALRAVADPYARPETVRRDCTAAIESVRAASRGTHSGEYGVAKGPPEERLLTELERLSPVGLWVELRVTAGGMHLPEGLVAPLHRAGHEALRNVARHSGVDRAVVRLELRRDAAVMEVIDAGAGLPDAAARHGQVGCPEASGSYGFGILNSIVGPIARHGGSVEFAQTPGGGTTVRMTLTWPAAKNCTLIEAAELADLGAGGRVPINGSIVWPVGAYWTYVALAHPFTYTRPWINVIVWLAFFVLTGGMTYQGLRRPPDWRWLVEVIGGFAVLQGLSLALMDSGSLLDLRSWSVGAIGIAFAVAGSRLPAVWTFVFAVSQLAILTLAWALRPELAAGQPPLGSYNAIITPAIVSGMFGALLRRSGRAIRREQAELEQVSMARALAAASASMRSVHLEHTTSVVVPWLAHVLDSGSISEQDRVRAALLSLEVRDDLYAPGFLDPELRSLVSEFRTGGGQVQIRSGFAPRAANRPIGAVLRELVTGPSATQHRVSLSPPVEGTTRARVAITPPPDPERLAVVLALNGVSLIETDEFAVILGVEDLASDNSETFAASS